MLKDDDLKKVLQAAKDQEDGKNPMYNGQNAEIAEDMGLVEVGNGGRLTLTDNGRKKLSDLS